MLLGRKKSRSVSRLYTTGEVNRTADALLHPLAKLDPAFLVLDGVVYVIIDVRYTRNNDDLRGERSIVLCLRVISSEYVGLYSEAFPVL
jgi:hypothetical protein